MAKEFKDSSESLKAPTPYKLTEQFIKFSGAQARPTDPVILEEMLIDSCRLSVEASGSLQFVRLLLL